MRRVLIALIVAGASLPAPAGAAERGAIEGVVMNETTGEPQAGAEVTLVQIRSDLSEAEETVARTDDRGRYAFGDLATGDSFFYTVDVTYKGGLYPSEALTLPADTSDAPVIETTTRVWEPTTDPGAVVIRRNIVFAIPRGDAIAVVESVKIVNLSDASAYVGRGADVESNTTAGTLGLALPPDATESTIAVLESSLNVPELRKTSFGMTMTSAIPPGETDITYSYRLAGDAATYDLSRTALYPILELSVLAQDLRIESNRLEEDGRETIDDKTYMKWSAPEDLDAGDRLQMIAIADAGTSSVLVAGAIALGVLVLAGLAFWAIRRGARTMRARAPRTRSHDEIVMEIARLDLQHEAGEVPGGEWERRRSALRAELDEAEAKVPG